MYVCVYVHACWMLHTIPASECITHDVCPHGVKSLPSALALRNWNCCTHCMNRRDEIAASKSNMRKLWRSLSGVLGETSSDVFDDYSAADFAAFFTDKINAVRASTSTTPPYNVVHSATSTMDTWPAVTTDEVKKLIDSALNKTCQLDPAPTWLVKEVGGLLSPFIALLCNKSLTTGCFPSEFKQAVVRPLLKKSGLDSSLLKNYRPVSRIEI